MPLKLEPTDRSSLCILGEKVDSSQVLTEYSLPKKILEEYKNVIIRGSDMNIKCGGYIEGEVIEMCSLFGMNTLYTSKRGSQNIWPYSVGFSSPGMITQDANPLLVPLVEPKFCCTKEKLFAVKNAEDHGFLVDIERNVAEKVEFEDSGGLFPLSCSHLLFTIVFGKSGAVVLFDQRTNTLTNMIPETNKCGEWKGRTNFDQRFSSESTKLLIYSSEGLIKIYDLRNPTRPVLSSDLNIDKSFDCRMSPSGSKLSTSFDGLVKIYSCESTSLEEIFTHEGHLKESESREDVSISDHFWFDNDCLVSSANNSSVHIWKYVVNSM